MNYKNQNQKPLLGNAINRVAPQQAFASHGCGETEARPEYLTAPEAAAYLRLAVQTLARWRCEKSDGPKFTRAGRKILYAMSDLDAYLTAGQCRSTSDGDR